ncbi:hypothetical protein HPP92_014333 [Vanilla planifolia]|uniref:Late embryogenesis abundant protein n=1 Tax=Vanilla planifolia TaxID=51239 RepID=A0A835QTN2_VANPL|nr:hypothetical protein HPP92_014333 [Vanilla planifolia]
MAAASSKGREIAGRIGKRLANQIRAVNSSRDLAPLFISRRAAHADSYYEKEIEEQVRPAVVPDHVIGARSDNYWGPHPTTGVFGPADLNGTAGGNVPGFRHPPGSDGSSSALDQTVRFRPLEDLEKPNPA